MGRMGGWDGWEDRTDGTDGTDRTNGRDGRDGRDGRVDRVDRVDDLGERGRARVGPGQRAGSGKAAAGFRIPRPSAGFLGGGLFGEWAARTPCAPRAVILTAVQSLRLLVRRGAGWESASTEPRVPGACWAVGLVGSGACWEGG
jgi:hypothetical protein